jgi:uncharacterized membrane protein YvlD (DUF360 family)
MTHAIRTVSLYLVRFAILWLVDAISLLATSWVLPGIIISAVEDTPRWTVALAAAFLLSIINLLIRPAIFLIARPLGWVALFAIGFFVNTLALWITGYLMPGFEVTFLGGVLGGVVFAFFNSILTGILDVDEEGSFYQNRIEKRAREQPFAGAGEPGRGLMMLEIDGLSYWHINEALDRGLLPTLKQMMEEEGYVLSHVECGLPSMTSSCQAGIMFGENDDIPAYRWYDKQQQKLYVSARDATELNARYAHGQGLMREGSSIMNMLAGDAEKSIFTMANMWSGSDAEKRRRAQDVALLMLDPYFFMRTLVLLFWEAGRELWEAFRQRANNVQPRLNRLEHWYPLVRAAMCGFMRDISTNIAILDIMRGAPSIYMLYLGYDEVAHHSGPWTEDAFGDLKRLDKTFARLHRVLRDKAPRPYSFIILSDHGQSFGATFKQRYGVDIKQFIEQQLPQGVSVAQAIGGDTGSAGLHGVAGELANLQQTQTGGAVTQAVAKQGEKLARQGALADEHHITAAQASVTAYGSGNAAQVYFDLAPRKLTLSELEAAYPGMVDALVGHPGLGMVIGYADDMTAVVLGKGGRRNLHSGALEGDDPVLPYAPATGHGAASLATRIWQLRRVMDFRSAGDLWLISTVYPDGTVAALEELVGSHGGVGGEQTDAFLFHPADLDVPQTRCSTDVFHILDGHRDAPVIKQPVSAAPPAALSWAPGTLLAGLARVRDWGSLALRCLILERAAYQEVVRDPYMTGPSLLIALVTLAGASVARYGEFNLLRIGGAYLIWLLMVAIIFGAGYLLSRRGNYTSTLRSLGFAQIVTVLEVFSLFGPAQSAVHAVVFVVEILALWLAAATAHQLRGWRAALLPVIAVCVYVFGSILLSGLVAGAGYTLQALLHDVGLVAR